MTEENSDWQLFKLALPYMLLAALVFSLVLIALRYSSIGALEVYRILARIT